MWPYMCLCYRLLVRTQFHFECCGVGDVFFLTKNFVRIFVDREICERIRILICIYIYIYIYLYIYGYALSYARVNVNFPWSWKWFEWDKESLDLKDGEPCLRRADVGGGSRRCWRSHRSLCLEKGDRPTEQSSSLFPSGQLKLNSFIRESEWLEESGTCFLNLFSHLSKGKIQKFLC